MLTQRSSTAGTSTTSRVSKALETLCRRSIVVGSNNSWSVPENDFQGVESTRGHQASAFLKEGCKTHVYGNDQVDLHGPFEVKLSRSTFLNVGFSVIFDDILLQVFPLSCSSCPSQSSAPTGRPQHHPGLGLLGSPLLTGRIQLARPSEAQKADWARARARPRRRKATEWSTSRVSHRRQRPNVY